MSALTEFRDHARRLSTSAHLDDCDRIHPIRHVLLDDAGRQSTLDRELSCPDTTGHPSHWWDHPGNGLDWHCPGLCDGCMPDTERVLWTRLADEIDTYLSPASDGDEPSLFDQEHHP